MVAVTLRIFMIALSFMLPEVARAQSQPGPDRRPSVQQAPTQQTSTAAQQLLSVGQLDALVAPIALSRYAAVGNPDGLDLSARSHRGRPLGASQQESQGRHAQSRGRSAELGRQREIARRDAVGAGHDERQALLDPAASAMPCWRSSRT
jgi:hypothetical protein